MAERRPLMAGNWKMNLNHLEAIAHVQKVAFSLNEKELADVEAAVLPPFTDLRSVQTLIEGDKYHISYGAQDVSQHDDGAYTGEVSGSMLAKLGCTYVVVGHSERRQYHAETDEIVNAKARKAIEHGMTAIVCVGEDLTVRQSGDHVHHTLAQVSGSLAGLTDEHVADLVIAYEPVWAIGTGEVATPQDAQEVCGAIRAHLAQLHSADVAERTRILYGGSVKSSNVAAIMAETDIDGALIGGASLDPDEFATICKFPQHPPVA
ncbi:MAG: triose-phosphate isomerase [Candidatus Nanopelagicales bacterium]